MTGKVKFFKSDKGWGFITGEDGKDYFVHQKYCIDTIEEGDSVEFKGDYSGTGSPSAVDVKNTTFDF